MRNISISDVFFALKSKANRLRNAIDWAVWVYKNDYGCSSGYAIDMFRRKLEHLEKVVREDDQHPGQDKYAKQIRIVLEHFRRARESYRYYDHDFPMGEPDDSNPGKFIFGTLSDADRAKQSRMLKFIDNMEKFHEQSAWRLVCRWHHGWWA